MRSNTGFELRMRIGHRFVARAAPQKRMDHLPLNRSRPDDRDLHHDVVKARRLHARQHRLLRARFDLKDADCIGALHHRVRRGGRRPGWRAARDRGYDAGSADRAPRSGGRCVKASRRSESIPRPSRSILISPSSWRSSLSHWMTVRSRIVAHSTGATRTSGSRVITMPPEWMPICRGKPAIRRQNAERSPSSP